ncbi:alpha/beta fold hydrolase [Streptococcus saliviloxodontae]|uniref:Pimeloyl-ACP methyl ester carboxylesterase n=1 Tax=Streptococcus saliviloxodontae TaxID=1349416 RepID=A0ABS2PIL5_9STRE|nr:alpha/beta hydrolase [Streptococcus saliviloxodontae]MBM7635268.1 pimeloyl-ACP methyl ester carboxylesterase [Streptococcus saliviloxodontae]
MKQFFIDDKKYVSYDIIGKGFPILFLHGNGLSHNYFKKQRDLADQFQLILLDTRGHGQSSKTTELNFEMMADDVERLLAFLKVSSCLVVGHSDGANLAMVYSRKYPQRIAGLLLNGGNLSLSGLWFPIRLAVRIEQIFFSGLATLSRQFYQRLAVAKLLSEDVLVSPRDFVDTNYPVIVLVGKWDLIKPSHNQAIAKLYPKGELVILPRAGHNPAHSQTNHFNQWILALYQKSKEC